MKRQISLLLAALLLLTLLVGCGGSGSAKPAAAEYNGYAYPTSDMLGIHYGRKPIRPENCPIEPKRIKENWSSIFCPIHICPSLTGKPS